MDNVESFIGKNSAYYTANWRHTTFEYFNGINFAAGFFFTEWAMYRKLYPQLLIFLTCQLALGGIFTLLPLDRRDVLGTINVCMHILMGVIANGLYRKKAMRCVAEAAKLPDEEADKYITRHGGTNPIGLIVLLVLDVAVIAYACFRILSWYM